MKRCLMLALLALLTACASLLTRDLPQLQIAPAALGQPRTVQQQLQISYPGGGAVMDAVLQMDQDNVEVIASAMGLRMATLDYDGHALKAQTLPAMKVPPQRIMNDLLMVFAPHNVLQQALPQGWVVHDDGNKRTILRGDDPTIDITWDNPDHWQGRAVLVHHQLAYTLTIDSSTVE
ncbi:DUF3261 domain-containing protein [Silvimonas iriomotensis]|nr:DUF3261 domain-containing protein [Silvimonas iriomotensis]